MKLRKREKMPLSTSTSGPASGKSKSDSHNLRKGEHVSANGKVSSSHRHKSEHATANGTLSSFHLPTKRRGGMWRSVRHVFWAAFWCAGVVLVNGWLAMIAYTVWHAFWLSLFWVGFLPIWLACYGMLFASRWLWRELAIGVFAAVSLVCWILFHEMESMRYRVLMSITFGLVALLVMTLGFWTERLYRSLLADWRSSTLRHSLKNFWG